MSVYVLDASVAVSAVRANDANHARAAAYLAPLLLGTDSIVVPSIFEVEIVATLIRAGLGASAPNAVGRARDNFLLGARVITIGPRAARAASRVAARTRLRTGDAIYVWVAEREQLPLVTFDGEILARGPAVGVTVIAPP